MLETKEPNKKIAIGTLLWNELIGLDEMIKFAHYFIKCFQIGSEITNMSLIQ